MKTSSILSIATLLLLMTSGVGLAEQAGASTDDADAAAAAKAVADGVGPADCNPVFKAKSAEKSKSPREIAAKLDLPIEKVNACFMILRQAGRPQANQ